MPDHPQQALTNDELARRIERHYRRNGSRGTYLASRAMDGQLAAAVYKLLDRVRLTVGLGRASRPPYLPRGALAVGRDTAREVQARLNGQTTNGRVRRRRQRGHHLAATYRPAAD